MNILNRKKQITVIASLVEGNSIRATCRMTGVAKGTVISLLERLGAACAKYQDEKIKNITSRRIQCDEIWSAGRPAKPAGFKLTHYPMPEMIDTKGEIG